MRQWYTRYLVLAAIMTSVVSVIAEAKPPSETSSVQIEILDGATGQPIQDTHLLIFMAADKQAPRSSHTDATTDRNGVVALHFIPAKTSYLQIWVDWHIPCFKNPNSVLYSTSDIMERGVVSENSCGTARTAAKPGVIVVYARRRHWWETTKLREGYLVTKVAQRIA